MNVRERRKTFIGYGFGAVLNGVSASMNVRYFSILYVVKGHCI